MKQTGGYFDSGCSLEDDTGARQASEDYRRGVNDAIIWLLKNQHNYNAAALAEVMAVELT